MDLDLHKYEENIKKTGFPLEFRISETLRKGKWSVINNSSSDTIEAMKKLLNDIYRYKGYFKFTKFADFDDW